MRHLGSRSIALVLSTVLAAAQASARDSCPDLGWCHLPRWVPAEAAPFEELGTAVAFDDTHAALGAPGGDAVYVYARVDGLWVQQQRLAAPPSSGGGFGSSLALFEGRLVVGDPTDTTLGLDAGAAHLFLEAGGSWNLQAVLTDPAGAPGDRLATSVDATSTYVVAGAPGDSDGGRVHLFREPAGWVWWTSLHDFATGTSPEAFGSAVAMQGAWLMIGDPASDTHAVDTGAVLTYQVLDIFSLFQDLTIPGELEAGDGFGGALDFDGEHLLVGARGDDGLGADAGAAYLFSFDEVEVAGQEVHHVQTLTACAGEGGDDFGAAVAVDGERLVVGAPGQGPPGMPVGRAQVFRRVPGAVPETWEPATELAPGDGLGGDAFGAAVSLVGPRVLVGGPGIDAVGDASGGGYLVSLASAVLPGGECPCEHLTAAASFGAGKPGSAGVPRLELGFGPVPGETSSLRLSSGLAGAAPLLLWGTTPTAFPFDGGELYVLDVHVQPLPTLDASGACEVAWDVPSDPSLCGAVLVFQAMLVDPAAGGEFLTAQSAGLELRIGW